ncbi:MAG: hypothetical protein INH41_31685 [Myxococcaceae bacterium]|nr:hypothetical protein [Myxococcaceae bacterium]MCA3016968.1 hypothetical protein [Myxococcaceae bacterium]
MSARGVSACGARGQACALCGITADGCNTQGECACGDGRACALGQRCVDGECRCDGDSCPAGCCASTGQCVALAEQSEALCGTDGAACAGCTSPPAATCSGSTRMAFQSPGLCNLGRCRYTPVELSCASGCDAGSCMGDVCQGCLAPPPFLCLGNVQRRFASPGVCGASGCAYGSSDTVCAYNCSAGACLGDPCSGVMCTTPPPASCSGSVRKGWVSPGACRGGTCSYAPQETTCASGCANGRCLGDACQGIACNTPPSAICLNGSTRRAFREAGTCSGGSCSYAFNDTGCAFGCVNGVCSSDPCSGVICNAPPAADCFDASTRRTYNPVGTCVGSVCSYGQQTLRCNTPPATTCLNASTRRSYGAIGTCSGSSCSYAPVDVACPFGCANAACNPDPCQGVTCTTPPAATCVNATTRRAYAPVGSCSGGMCSYAPTDTTCPYGCASGVCIDPP